MISRLRPIRRARSLFGSRIAAAAALAIAMACAPAAPALADARLGADDFSGVLSVAERMPRLRSLLVSHNGELIVESYFNGARPNQTTNVKSVSKTIMSALIGLAIDEGHIESLDQPISDYYGELLAELDDPRKATITVGNLLSMQAGLETTSFYNYGQWVLSNDWIRFALEQPMLAEPGTRLLYSTGNTHLLSAILTAATGQSSFRFAREQLTRPLDFDLAAWDRDPNGIYFGGNNMAFTPRQMLAFGETYINGGEYRGRQVIPAEWVKTSTRKLVESPRENGRYYGYGWWIRNFAGFDAPYAWGYGGQFIVLVPELDLVVVTTSSSEPGDGRRAHIRSLYGLIEHGVVVSAADGLGEFRPVRRVRLPADTIVDD